MTDIPRHLAKKKQEIGVRRITAAWDILRKLERGNLKSWNLDLEHPKNIPI